MSSHEVWQESTVATPVTTPGSRSSRAGRRLVGIDAARGLALIGLLAVHILPDATEDGDPTLAWNLFAGDSAALFALLAGAGLALATGGSSPHRGRALTADRAGLVVRAALIGIVGLVIAAILPAEDPPADGILLYYAVFFLLALPFLQLGPKALLLSAAGFALVSPVLMQRLGPALPESSADNHTVVNLITEPVGTAAELLLTGTYPAMIYMTYLLVGLGLGRLDLRATRVQGLILGIGAGLAVVANLASALLINVAGGYQTLLETSGMSAGTLDQTLVFGPEGIIPDSSAWWLAIATPHTNTPLAVASSLGTAMAVLGVVLLLAPKAGRWLTPLAAMGAMTLTLYTAHLLALAPELHYDEPALWFALHLLAAAVFAWAWHRKIGQGPLERVVATGARNARQILTD
jgi:uncharacterized membrane protein